MHYPKPTQLYLWNHTCCAFRNIHHINSTLPGCTYPSPPTCTITSSTYNLFARYYRFCSALFQITTRYTLCIRGQSCQGSDSDAGLVRWWKDDCGEIAAAQLMISEFRRLYSKVNFWVFRSSLNWFSLAQPSRRIWTKAKDYNNCLALDMLWILSLSQHIKMDKLTGLSHVKHIFTTKLHPYFYPIYIIFSWLYLAWRPSEPFRSVILCAEVTFVFLLSTSRCICLTLRPLFHFSYDPPSVRGRVWALHGIAVQWNTIETLQDNTIKCKAMYWTPLHWTVLWRTPHHTMHIEVYLEGRFFTVYTVLYYYTVFFCRGFL